MEEAEKSQSQRNSPQKYAHNDTILLALKMEQRKKELMNVSSLSELEKERKLILLLEFLG
jgi:hypothetical protein